MLPVNHDLPHRMFVYGTLKKGQPNHYNIETTKHGRCQFIGAAVTQQAYPLIIATHWNLPFLLHAPDSGCRVVGEIYDVDDELLTWMDDFEGHPDVYHRDKVFVSVTSLSRSGTLSSEMESCRQRLKELSTMKGNCLRVSDGCQEEDDAVLCRKHLHVGSLKHQLSAEDRCCRIHELKERCESCHQAARHRSNDEKENRTQTASELATCECWCYFLHEFPAGLLSKESYASYDSNGSHKKAYKPDDDLCGPDNIDEALRRDCSDSVLISSSIA